MNEIKTKIEKDRQGKNVRHRLIEIVIEKARERKRDQNKER